MAYTTIPQRQAGDPSSPYLVGGPPSAAPGLDALVYSIAYDYVNLVSYVKYGTAATAWQSITGTNLLPKVTVYESLATGAGTLNGTHTLQPATNSVRLLMISNGGAGGAGACADPAGAATSGGGGGGGGCLVFCDLKLTAGVRTIAYSLNECIAGGASRSTIGTGANGGVAINYNLLVYNSETVMVTPGPNGGGGGGTSIAPAGNATPGSVNGASGGNGPLGAAGSNGPVHSSQSGGGGGGGGGIAALGATAFAGGIGGYSNGALNEPARRGASGPINTAGGAPSSTPGYTGQPGGGGGGASITGAAGAGADGTLWGSGGGGGGASLNGNASGKGGNGGPGAIIIFES
jgi:hypothetical protein